MLSRRALLGSTSAVLHPLTERATGHTATGNPPNLVVIIADYMGYSDTEPYGATDVRTPNLKRLAREGVRLTNAYASAPVCAPSRAALLTGRYQQRFGVERNPIHPNDPGIPTSERTIPELLRDRGYATFMIGKWHLGFGSTYGPNARGFDASLAFYDWSIDYFSHRTPQGMPGLFEDGRPVQLSGYSTDVFTDRAVSLIRRNSSRPYFGYIAYNATLPPHQSPRFPADVRAKGPRPVSTRVWHKAKRQDYLDTIEAMDAGVGRILTALDNAGATRNTMVLFTCDHGGREDIVRHSPLSGGFGTLSEGGIRVPLIIRWPGVLPAGVVSQQQAILMDVAATVLGAVQITPPLPLDGIDLTPALQGSMPLRERTFCWRNPYDKSQAIRSGRWKLRHDSKGEALFDLDADEGEKHNLAMKHPDKVTKLRQLLADWELSVLKAR